jgi:hypothetical protein
MRVKLILTDDQAASRELRYVPQLTILEHTKRRKV